MNYKMEQYFNNLNEEVRKYLKILSPEFPEWLLEYINTPEMLRLDGVGMSCGTIYTKVYNDKYFYSRLTHSIAVALIIWNFTKDKKQALAGLFHDIATPAFSHCIDYLNGDSVIQESTEEKTEHTIRNSEQILDLLKKDEINVKDVIDYKKYPIADNSTPKLSADRFEYTLSGGLYQEKIFELEEIRTYYNNIVILKNEEGTNELGFKDIDICEKFIHKIPKLWNHWVEDEDRACLQYMADILKSLCVRGYITIDDLYKFSDNEVIKIIQNCEDEYIKDAFKKFQNATKRDVYKSEEFNDKIYCISVRAKKRYINPLVNIENNAYRIKDVSAQANSDISNYLNTKYHTYIGFNFDFKPYNK